MFLAIAIAIVFTVLLAALLLFAATKPDTFRYQREINIQGPPEKILPLIDDFHNWKTWSPWERLDPAMKKNFTGAPSGKGAVYEWEGNSKVGKGRMEILDISPRSQVTIKLDFLKPFEAHNTAEFILEPRGELTTVTWAMHGPNAYFNKLMQVFMNMDRLLGKDFEAGLANLKRAVEA